MSPYSIKAIQNPFNGHWTLHIGHFDVELFFFLKDRMPIFEEPPVQFRIVTENTERVFFGSNNIVNGTVVLELAEPKKSSGVFITFRGWTYLSAGDNAFIEDIFSFKTALWSPQNGLESDMIPAGIHRFPFTFSIPVDENIPPSFLDDYDGVEYILDACIERPHRLPHTMSLRIVVIPVVDCNLPKYAVEVQREEEKTVCCCCCSSGPITLTARVPSAAYCPGEVIPVHARVENRSTSTLYRVSCSFVSDMLMVKKSTTSHRFRNLASSEVCQTIPPSHGRSSSVFLLRIPPCAPSFPLDSGRIVSLSYSIHVVVTLPLGHSNVVVKLPITIGTIPHRSPPLFSDQISDEQQPQAPLCPWANPGDITRMASIQTTRPDRSSISTDFESYDDSLRFMFQGGKFMRCVYFEMPKPVIPSFLTSSGDESTPLLDGNASTPGSDELKPTTTTTSSISPLDIPSSIFVSDNNA